MFHCEMFIKCITYIIKFFRVIFYKSDFYNITVNSMQFFRKLNFLQLINILWCLRPFLCDQKFKKSKISTTQRYKYFKFISTV